MTIPSPLDNLRNRLPMSWLRERDVDLLLCSELHCDGGPLRALFVGDWNNGIAEFDGAWVSYVDSEGEADLVAAFKSGAKSLVLIIEDKIDAEFQPEQPERYRRRAQRWAADSAPGATVETVLFAPADYLGNAGSELFDRQISYEEVIAALSTVFDPRTRFLAQTLKNGIDPQRQRQSYTPQYDDAATQVWNAIWEIANAVTPQLRMRKPPRRPAGSSFIYFPEAEGLAAAETRRRVKIVYKPAQSASNADLQFSNTLEETLRTAVGGALDADMTVAAAEKSACVRIKIPIVDFGKSPEGQEEAIRQGLQAAERLRLFYIEKQPLALLPAP